MTEQTERMAVLIMECARIAKNSNTFDEFAHYRMIEGG